MSSVLLAWIGPSPNRDQVRLFVATNYHGSFEIGPVVRRPCGLQLCQVFGLNNQAPEVIRALHGLSLEGNRVSARMWSLTYFLPHPLLHSIDFNQVGSD